MGTDISPGLVLEDGTLVHDADFNLLVGNATILPTAISAKTLKPEMSLGDELLVNDGGTLRKITGQQIVTITATPAGCMMDYVGTTEPLGWAFCYGQELSRTTYATLFATIGTAFGVGDGSTTFNVPDFRGRITVGRDDMGGTAANRITSAVSGFDAKVLGNVGGSEKHLLTAAESGTNMPSHQHAGVDHLHSMNNHVHNFEHRHQSGTVAPGAVNVSYGSGFQLGPGPTSYVAASDGQSPNTLGPSTPNTGAADRSLTTGAVAAVNSAASSAHRNLQPSIIVNKIIKT